MPVLMVKTAKKHLCFLLSDIRFWIVLFFLIRMYGITDAPLETTHNWRQSLTNMIARNFYQVDSNIFFPRIDMAGEKSGIIGSEFPLFNYLIYGISFMFDYSHWYGRLLNLVVSSFGAFYFYKIIKELFSQKIAFHSTLILSVSIWFSFSRKIMPDTFSVALVIIGLYYALRYFKEGKTNHLMLYVTFITLGILCKIPSLSLLAVLTIVPLNKSISSHLKIKLYAVTGISLLAVCSWYFLWVPYLVDTYKFQLYFPKGLIEGFQEIVPLWTELLEKFYFTSLKSYAALLCLMVGIYLFIKNETPQYKLAIGSITLIFILFIFKTGAVFPLHEYYIIPFVPIMALLAGYATSYIHVKIGSTILAFIVVEAIANQQHDFFQPKNQQYKLEINKMIHSIIPQNDLIIVNGGQSPQNIYFTNRKGWCVNDEDLELNFIDSLKLKGAKYLVLDKAFGEHDISAYKCLNSTENYTIVKL